MSLKRKHLRIANINPCKNFPLWCRPDALGGGGGASHKNIALLCLCSIADQTLPVSRDRVVSDGASHHP